jgi:hypothetical protein
MSERMSEVSEHTFTYSLSESVECLRRTIQEAWRIYQRSNDNKVRLRALRVVQEGQHILYQLERLSAAAFASHSNTTVPLPSRCELI